MKKRYRKRKAATDAKSPRHITAHLVEIDNPLAHVPKEELPGVLKKIGATIDREHARLLTRFDQLIHACNPIQVLSHFAFYDRFLYNVQKSGIYKPLLQHSVEFFQGYFLSVPIEELNVHITSAEVLLELNEVLKGLEATFPMLGFGKQREDADMDRTRSLLSHELRAHTYGVRNAGYFQQVMTQLREVFGDLDSAFESTRGVKLSSLVTMNERVLKLIEVRLQAHVAAAFKAPCRNTAADAVNAYCNARNLSQDIRSEMLNECTIHRLNVEEARNMCAHHAGLTLPQIYTVELSDFVAAYPDPVDPHRLLSVLAEWSLPPQGLIGFNRAHLFLNNPIWQKPIVQIGPDLFLWPMVELFHSFGLEMLEGLIRSEPSLWERYQSKARAVYLEERVYALCRDAFPDAQIFHGSIWRDPQNGVDGENDVLVLLDTVALTIECKSGRITPEARRGLPDRLRREIHKLIEDAAKQNARFAKLLLQSNEVLKFPTRKCGVNEIDASKIKRVIPLNVTLDYFGPLACATRDLLDSNLIDSAITTAPTLALVDFENVLHLLETPIERLHYFARRGEIERNISLYAGEEDLLACYLATGLNFGPLEGEHTGRINLGKMQDSIQPYLMAYHSGRPQTKPHRKFTDWWKQILDRLQSRSFHNWTQAAFVILDVRYEDQVNFERDVKRLSKEVRSNWHHPGHNNTVVGVNGPLHRSTAVGAVIVKRVDREQRNGIIVESMKFAVEKAKTEEVVMLCLAADKPNKPYSALVYGPPCDC